MAELVATEPTLVIKYSNGQILVDGTIQDEALSYWLLKKAELALDAYYARQSANQKIVPVKGIVPKIGGN